MSTESKYTPGPLHVTTLERTFHFIKRSDEQVVGNATAEAGAILWAAAPDMAEALAELLNDIPFADLSSQSGDECECGEFVDHVPVGSESPTCKHTRARAALKKAGVL